MWWNDAPAHQIRQTNRERRNHCANVREAFRIATEERPGAVHLEFPEDIATETVTGDVGVFPINKIRRPVGEAKAVAEAVRMIEAATHPLILVGAGANRKLVSKSLLQFIEKTGIPFFNTHMGKGVIDERHPLYLGCAALSSNDYLHCAVDRADLIINIGHDVIEKPPFFMKHPSAHSSATQGDEQSRIAHSGQAVQDVIHVNFNSAQVDNIYFPQWEVLGDIGSSVWQITEKITPQSHWDFSYFRKVKKQIEEHLGRDSHRDSFPMIPQRIVYDVRAAMPDDGILALDNGMYKLWFARYYHAYGRNTILLDNALATMGAGLPSAIAAKLMNPYKKVLAVCGDGGFMMNSQELETAVRLKLDLVIIILNDNGYGMIKWKQDAVGFPDFGLNFGNPDFVKYAESYGATGHRVAAAEGLSKLLKDCFSQGGIHLIEVPIDYRENGRVFNQELKEKTCIAD